MSDQGGRATWARPHCHDITKSGNFDYSLFFKNCVTTSIDGLHKGILPNGKKYGEAFPYETIIPKIYKTKVQEAFGNTSFKEEQE